VKVKTNSLCCKTHCGKFATISRYQAI